MKNLKVGKKFLVVLGSVIVLFLVSLVVSISALRSAENSYKKFYNESHEAIVKTQAMRTNLQKSLKDILLATVESNMDKTKSYLAEIDQCTAEIDDGISWFELNYTGDTTLLNQYKTQMTAMSELRGRITDLAALNTNLGNSQAQLLVLEEYNPMAEEAVSTLVSFNEEVTAAGKSAYVSANRLNSTLLVLSLICSAIAFITAVVMATILTKSILSPVKELQGAMEEMENGNLNAVVNYTSKDELGQLADSVRAVMGFLKAVIADEDHLLSEMSNGNFDIRTEMSERYVGDYHSLIASIRKLRDNLDNTLSQINRSADQVSSGSEQVSSGAQALSQGATEQASSIEELAAAINEISDNINRSADNAGEASRKATTVGGQAAESNERMQEMLAAMEEISRSSGEIGKIIKTIEDIAFQTNILALNAAVEAARAGEAGKGFAVVADEVRNLAGKSAEASKNTSALIEGSLHAVEKGTRIANETAQSLGDVITGVSVVTKTIEGISDASAAQAESIVQITQGVDQISSVIQTNSATAEESAAASEELSSQAQMLKNLVSGFSLKGQEEDVTSVLQDQLGKNVTSFIASETNKY